MLKCRDVSRLNRVLRIVLRPHDPACQAEARLIMTAKEFRERFLVSPFTARD